MGLTKDQVEEAKRAYLEVIENAIKLDGLADNELKSKLKELHSVSGAYRKLKSRLSFLVLLLCVLNWLLDIVCDNLLV